MLISGRGIMVMSVCREQAEGKIKYHNIIITIKICGRELLQVLYRIYSAIRHHSAIRLIRIQLLTSTEYTKYELVMNLNGKSVVIYANCKKIYIYISCLCQLKRNIILQYSFNFKTERKFAWFVPTNFV